MISGPASYLPTVSEFLAHWAIADTALGAAGPVVVGGDGVTRAALTALRDRLSAKRTEIEAERNVIEGGRATLTASKTVLLTRLNQFTGRIRALGPGTPWEAMLPYAFSITDSRQTIRSVLVNVENIWTLYNDAVATEILLVNAYGLIDFIADGLALEAAFEAASTAQAGLNYARDQRTVIENAIQPILKAYRQTIPTLFLAGDPVVTTLPRLSPISTRTPDPVQANGTWNATTQKADLTWSASPDPDLANYEIRATAGPEYDTDDETTVATVPANAPQSFATDFALTTPGTTTTFKIYVILTTGNERGINAVSITRPV